MASNWDYEPDDDWDYDDGRDGYEPEPDYEAISLYEHERHMRRLSPLGRVRYRIRSFIWHHTWRWQMKARARWLLLTGRATTESDDGPPF